MNEENLKKLERKLQVQLRAAEGEIALKLRSKSRIEEKLKDVRATYEREAKKKSALIREIEGGEVVGKGKRIPKPITADDKIETPTVEMDLPAPPAPAPAPEKKKSKLTFFS